MIFLIEYDRQHGSLLNLSIFADGDRAIADTARLELELALNRSGIRREVVLLEAPSEEALRITHRRYFENPTELAEAHRGADT